MPKVSIQIMTYNGERFIRQVLDSCLNQTFQDFEICISDDASTDNTVPIIKEYQERFPEKIKLFIQPTNMGIYSLAINGNAGRRMCTGKYLAVLDGDEEMEPQRLEKQVEFLDNNHKYIAVSHNKLHVNYFTGEIIPIKTYPKQEITTRDLILYGNLFYNCYMMRNIGLLYDHSIKVMSDWELIIRISLRGKLGFQNEPLTIKYIHDKNVTIERKEQFSEDRIVSLALLEHKYPELLNLIDIKRTEYYLAKIKDGDWRYIRGLVNSRFISIINLIILKYIKRRNIV